MQILVNDDTFEIVDIVAHSGRKILNVKNMTCSYIQ